MSAVADPFDARRVAGATGLLRTFNEVGLLSAADVHVASRLAELVSEVYSIEIVEPLAKSAEATLQRLGYKNVHLKIGDGYKGWPEEGPFDAIIVTCAPDKVPQPLVDQLKDDGRMVIPVGDRFAQQLYLLEKKNGQLKQSATLPVRFVPMTSEAAKPN